MYSAVDFKVVWPKLLFKSRPQLPCRDLNSLVATSTPLSRHHPCRDIDLNLCSLQLMFMMSRPQSLVATSLYAFAGVIWSPMMSRHQSPVATSAQVLWILQMVAPDVVTSISCCDINIMNCSFQLMTSVVAISIYAFAGFN